MFTSSVRLALLGAAALFFAADIQAVEGHAAADPSTLQASRAHHDRFVVKRGPAPPIKRSYAFKRSTPHEMPRATSTPVVKRANPWTPNVLPLVRGVSKGRAAGSRAALARAATTPATTTASAPSFVKRLLNDLLGAKNDAEPQGDTKPDEETTPTSEDVPDEAEGTPEDEGSGDDGTDQPNDGGSAGGVAEFSTYYYADMSIGDQPYTVHFTLSGDGASMDSAQDVKGGWDPASTPDAQLVGDISNGGDGTGKEYAVDVTVGGTVLPGTSVVAIDPVGAVEEDYVGVLAFGPKDSGLWTGRKATSPLETVGTFGLIVNTDGTGSLTLGSSPEGVDAAADGMTAQSNADLWAITGTMNGAEATADISFADGFLYGPKEDVTKMMTDAGLTPTDEALGDSGDTVLVAEVDCDNAPPITFDFGGSHALSWSAAGAAVQNPDTGKCQWLLKGAVQGDYPTPYSIGLFGMSFPMTFNAADMTIAFHPLKPDSGDGSGSGSDGSAEGGESEGEDGQGTDSTETGDDTEAEDGSGDTTTSTEDGDEDVNSTEEGDGS